MGEDNKWSEGTVSRLVEIANRLEMLKEESGVFSIINKCIHISKEVFAGNFGTTNVIREFKSPDSIRCSITIDGIEFAAWFDIPKGVKVITCEQDTESYVRLEDVELKP